MNKNIARARAFALALLLAATLAIAQSATDPSGDWRGTLDAGATRLRIALHLGVESTFDSPDQGAHGLPAQFSVADGKVTVQLRGAGEFVGTLSADGNVLEGTYRQGGASFPLKFERGTFTQVHRPQTPQPPFPYKVEEVEFGNPAEPGLRLAATLTTPQGPGPFPAVVLITGSGAQDRDETLYSHKPFAVLADALTRRGIAVLRVDDRGVGRSTAGFPDPTTESFAGDAGAAVAMLRLRQEIDASRIGLLGHSEGGIIAPLVATRDGAIAFVVLWAAPAVNGKEVLIDQVSAQAALRGASAAQVQQRARLQREILDAVVAADPDATRARVDAVLARNGAPPLPAAAVSQLNSAWYQQFLARDPALALRTLQMPVLALLGGKDLQVSVQLNEAPLRAALAGNPGAIVEVLPGLNHLFQTAPTGNPAEYSQIEETIAPAALQRMVDWIAATTGASAP